MKPREIANDIISGDGYKTYVYVHKILRSPTEDAFSYEEYMCYDIGEFLIHFQQKADLYNRMAVYLKKKNKKGLFLDGFFSDLKNELTTDEKVYIALRYNVTL